MTTWTCSARLLLTATLAILLTPWPRNAAATSPNDPTIGGIHGPSAPITDLPIDGVIVFSWSADVGSTLYGGNPYDGFVVDAWVEGALEEPARGLIVWRPLVHLEPSEILEVTVEGSCGWSYKGDFHIEVTTGSEASPPLGEHALLSAVGSTTTCNEACCNAAIDWTWRTDEQPGLPGHQIAYRWRMLDPERSSLFRTHWPGYDAGAPIVSTVTAPVSALRAEYCLEVRSMNLASGQNVFDTFCVPGEQAFSEALPLPLCGDLPPKADDETAAPPASGAQGGEAPAIRVYRDPGGEGGCQAAGGFAPSGSLGLWLLLALLGLCLRWNRASGLAGGRLRS